MLHIEVYTNIFRIRVFIWFNLLFHISFYSEKRLLCFKNYNLCNLSAVFFNKYVKYIYSLAIALPDSTLCMNYYNNTLYYGVMHEKNSGLYRVDCSKMSKAEKIYDKGVCSIYILDDEYVYFTDFDENLYRIKNDTKNVEVVFSIQNK